MIVRFGQSVSNIATNPLQPGELIVASLQTNKLTLYNTKTTESASLLSTLPRIHDKKIEHFEFHPKSRLCLSVSQDAVVLWDTLKLKAVKVLNCPSIGPRSVSVDQTGQQDTQKIGQIHGQTQTQNSQKLSTQKTKTSSQQTQFFRHACFHNNDLLTCINDKIYIWNLQNYNLKSTLEMPPNTSSKELDCVSFAVTPDGAWLLSGGRTHNYISIWNYSNKTLHRMVALPYGTNGIQKILFSPDSQKALILTKEGKIICMRLNDFFILFEIFRREEGFAPETTILLHTSAIKNPI